MNKIKDYLTNPTTRISFCIFVFWIGVVRWSLNSRIEQLEKNVNDMDLVKIQTTLSQIQTDLTWIKQALQKM
jgi:hypothetical protein